MDRSGILLFAHGARDPNWARPFETVADRLRARGDEIVGHGVTNSDEQGHLTEDAERAMIAQATAEITAYQAFAPSSVTHVFWGAVARHAPVSSHAP